jgi:hypothetical protein
MHKSFLLPLVCNDLYRKDWDDPHGREVVQDPLGGHSCSAGISTNKIIWNEGLDSDGQQFLHYK